MSGARALGRSSTKLLASVGGVGYCPVAPGTAGSAAALLAYLALPLHAGIQAAVIAVVTFVGLWASSAVAAQAGDHDPSEVVIDEAAGLLIACFLVPKSIRALAAAFLLFRLFDVGKWFPMKQLERLPGGWGIMADDLAAGLLARLVLLIWV
jgi:phosphatidylglycerophosphatase A